MAITAASLRVLIGADDTKLTAALLKSEKRLQAFASMASSVGTSLTLGVTAPLLLLGHRAVGIAADFEQSMNVLQATSSASGQEMAALSDLAKQLGADMELPGTSADDAAQALNELVKGGLSVKDAMDAARPTLQLSAAAQIDNARAAVLVTDALSTFSLKGENAAAVTDLLAGAANASTGTIEMMSDAISQSGNSFAQAGIGIHEAVTAISLMANAGIKGSDAGTSLKNALIKLAKPSKEAAILQDKLGVSLFDTQGRVKPLRKFVGELHTAYSNLSSQQKINTSETFAGTDALRAIGVLAKSGTAEFDRMAAAVGKEGSAAKLAAAQNKGLKGAMDAMASAFETASQSAIEPLIKDLTDLAKKAGEVVGAFAELPAETRRTIVLWAAAAAALGPLILGLGKLVGAIATVRTAIIALRATGGILAALVSGPLAAFTAAVGFAALAWSQNWGHIKEVATSVWRTLVGLFTDGTHILSEAWGGVLDIISGKREQGAERIMKAGTDLAKAFLINYAVAVMEFTPPKVKPPQIDTGKGGGMDDLLPDKGPAGGVVTPTDKQSQEEAFAKRLGNVQAQIREMRRGVSTAATELLGQFDKITVARRGELAAAEETLKTLQDERTGREQFSTDLEALNDKIREERAGVNGVSDSLLELQKRYAGTTDAQLEYFQNQQQVLKGLKDEKDLTKDLSAAINDQKRELHANNFFTRENALAAKFLGDSLKTGIPPLQQMTNAQQVQVVRLQQLIDKTEVATIKTQRFNEVFTRVNQAVGNASADASEAETSFEILTRGTDLARFAWEKYGVELHQLDETTLAFIQRQMELGERTAGLTAIVQSTQQVFQQAFMNLDDGFSGFFNSVVDGFRNMLQQLAAEFLAAEVTKLIIGAFGGNTGGITSVLGQAFGGKRAGGGPVNPNQAFLVGEQGPEFFIPPRAGRVEPIAGGGTVNNFTFNITAMDAAGVRKSQAQLMSDATRQAEAFQRRNG